jgi:V8-like Glu-specific endopeptidase
MKRAGILLLLALALLGAVVAPVQAAQPAKAEAVDQTRAEVVRYWTAERMRNAIPLDIVEGADRVKKPRLAIPFTRYEPTTYHPAHGKVFFSDGAANYVCSGTALTSGNESVVWTAGHCVNEGPGGFYTNWAFVPGYKDGARPYGTWTARTLLTTAAWGQQGDVSYDLGAAVMNTNGGATLTDTVGSRGAAFNQPAEQHYLSHGYPAAPPFTGGRMYVCESDLGTRDTSANPATMGIGCDMTGGSSGGGWIVGNTVLSVNSYGYTTQPNVMYGPYQGSVAQQLYGSAAGS